MKRPAAGDQGDSWAGHPRLTEVKRFVGSMRKRGAHQVEVGNVSVTFAHPPAAGEQPDTDDDDEAMPSACRLDDE